MGTHTETPKQGGLARYFVEHREVGWVALVAILIWGWVSYHQLAQQEDPKIPERRALLVTRFPGASAKKIEELVTQKIEEKVDEMQSIEELSSQSRFGVSVIHVMQRSASQARVDQEWEKLRAKLREVTLPEGCQEPFLDTDFGNTVTLLYGITSPPGSEPESVARANLLRSRLAELRKTRGSTGRAAVFAFFPPAIAESYRTMIRERFISSLSARGLASDVQNAQGSSYILADFRTGASRAALEAFLTEFSRDLVGTDAELHPDFSRAVILMGDEDPLPSIRATVAPRYSYRELELAAEKLEDALKQLPSVGRVRKIGNVAEAVYLYYSIANLEGFKIAPDDVIQAIRTRNAIIPGGVLRTEGQNFPVQLTGEFVSEEELLDTVAGTTSTSGGAIPVYLRDLFDVRRGYENPIPFKVDVLHRKQPGAPLQEARCVMLAVEMKEGNIIGRFGHQASKVVNAVKQRFPEGMEVLTLSDQPRAVTERVQQFLRCFIEAVMVVVLVALFLMDWRSALVVALAIPLTVAMTLVGMWVFGLPLHQISIAALIIALGMLVDDPVVASDGINRELAHGKPPATAAWLGPYRLRRAILFGTIINIVAFLPLVLLPSDKGAFIFALPMVVTLALVSSRVVSMTFVPLLGYYLLRGQKGLESGGEIRSFFLFKPVDRVLVAVLPRYRGLLETALNHPWRAIGVAYGALALSFALVPLFGTQFFPPAERNQLLIDVELPESASILQTREVCRQVSEILGKHADITTAAVFSGGTAPRFYYNVSPREPGEHLGQVLVNTKHAKDVPPLLVELRRELDQQIAGARCLVKQLEQGPPVEAPIQIRVSGEDLDILRGVADQVAGVLREQGAYKVHDDLGRRMPTLTMEIDQHRANLLEISNAQIGRLAQSAFYGLRVTELREGDHLIPVSVRLRTEERNEAEKIQTLYVRSVSKKLIPLNNFATVTLVPEFATIAHFNKLRTVTVKAYSPFGELPSNILRRAKPALGQLPLLPGYDLNYAGEEKELRQSQAEMGTVMMVSLGLIAFAMVVQFESVLKSMVVMLTVPLGLVGAFLGVAVMQTAMGFMALLGIVSLAGVIVSHIIVLSDFIEEARAEGMPTRQALIQAGFVRLRAVLATVLATVGGLVPLALTGGELWKPLTSVHIVGLLLATLLTLIILPVWYYLFAERLKWIR